MKKRAAHSHLSSRTPALGPVPAWGRFVRQATCPAPAPGPSASAHSPNAIGGDAGRAAEIGLQIIDQGDHQCVEILSFASLAALAAAGSAAAAGRAPPANLKMMIPANPGGGWDTTGRALGKAMQEAGVGRRVSYENKGGAAGAIGLAQFVNASKGDPNAMMVMGAVMLGGIITGKPPVTCRRRRRWRA